MTDRQILIDGMTAKTGVPKQYKRLVRRHSVEDTTMTFREVLALLDSAYSVETRNLFYNDGSRKGVTPAGNHVALVNPAWEGEDAADLPDSQDDAVWHVPTRSYTPVPHADAWEPLFEAIKGRDDFDVFGTIRLRRNGGEAHIDLFVESLEVDGMSDESITLGIQTGHDYFGNTRLYVNTVAYHDTGDGVGQVMRYLTDARKRKHVGSAGREVVEWYGNGLDRLEDVADTLYEVVADAMSYQVDMPKTPCSLVGFFDHLGLPNKAPHALADAAGKRAVQTATGPYTAYHLYKAAMWAIEHEYDSRDTSRFTQHVEAANLLLFNPALAEKRVLQSIEEEIEDADDENASVFDYVEDDPDVALDDVRDRAETISEGVEGFKSTREKLRAMLNDENPAPEGEADA